MRRYGRLPEDTDDVELPRYSRPIGVARGPVRGPSATDPGDSIGVLRPFAGLLNGPVELGGGAFPTFSYLILQPLVVERILEGGARTLETDRPEREERDRAETTPELRIYHLLRGDSGSTKVDNSTIRGKRLERRPGRTERTDDHPEPIRDVTVLETPRSRGKGWGVRADRPTGPLRDATVLKAPRMVVPATGYTGSDSTLGRSGRASSRGARLADEGPRGTGERQTLSPPSTTSSITNTVVQQPALIPAVARPGTDDTSTSASSSRERDASGSEDDTTSGFPHTTRSDRDRPTGKRGPELTLVTARPAPGREEPRGPGPDGESGYGPGERSGSGTGGKPPSAWTEREGSAPQPRSPPTMTSLLDNTTEMNRLVDRLYREFQRKTRIERERRGL